MGITITRREWIIVLIIAFIATALMQTPYVLGYAFAYPKTEFTGLLINLADTSYLAIIRQGFDGAWLYHNFLGTTRTRPRRVRSNPCQIPWTGLLE